MEYISIVAENYEEALKKAKAQYGENIRIHSRREYSVGGGLFTKKRQKTEIIFYKTKPEVGPEKLVSNEEIKEFEKEARTPDPDTLNEEQKQETVLTKAKPGWEDESLKLLDMNNIKGEFKEKILDSFFPTEEDIKLELLDKIMNEVAIDYAGQAHPKKYLILVGPTGSGKTTTVAKIASLYKNVGKKVGLISLDYYRTGAFEQSKAYAEAFSLPIACVSAEDELLLSFDKLSTCDLVVVDTMGISPKDTTNILKLKGMLTLFPEGETEIIMTCAATAKTEDLLLQYKTYKPLKISSLIATKLDETESIGSVLTFMYNQKLSIIFCTNGQKVPSDILKASTSVVIEYLSGFGYKIKKYAHQIEN